MNLKQIYRKLMWQCPIKPENHCPRLDDCIYKGEVVMLDELDGRPVRWNCHLYDLRWKK